RQCHASVSERCEECLIEQFVAQTAVEALDEGVLGRFARRDVVPFDPRFLRPAEDRHAGELRAVVADDRQGLAAPSDDGIEFAADAQARERGIGHQGQALSREVVHHREDTEPAAVAELVAQEVQRPALVRPLWDRQRNPCSQRSFASTTPADLQAFVAIEASQLLVVHVCPLAADQDQQTPVAEPAADGGKLAQPGAQDRIVGPHAAIPHRGPIRCDHLARPALAHLIGLAEMGHSLPPHNGRHHFFELRSFSIATSSIVSASSFFSLRFSSSSAFSLRASETSIPPNFAFHLKKVALLTPCLRHRSAVFIPASCSRNIPMICSSVNLERFIVRLLPEAGLYSNMEEVQGLRSLVENTNEIYVTSLADKTIAIPVY